MTFVYIIKVQVTIKVVGVFKLNIKQDGLMSPQIDTTVDSNYQTFLRVYSLWPEFNLENAAHRC